MLGRFKDFLFGLLLSLFVAGVLLVVARRPPGRPVELLPPPTPVPLRVHVTGAVNAPGVYALPRGSIVQDAIRAASGATERGDLSHINLAQLIRDGDQIIVPEAASTSTPPPPTVTVGPGTPSPTPLPTAAPSGSSGSAKININTATAAELETLPRIGPSLAQRIIDYRTANGPFRTVEEIKNVRGIGDTIFADIKDRVTVGP